MSLIRRVIIFLLLLVISFNGNSQDSSLREKKVAFSRDSIQLDTLSVFPLSIEVYCQKTKLATSEYDFSFSTGILVFHTKCADSLTVKYRVFPINYSKTYFKRDTSLIFAREKGMWENFLITENTFQEDIFGGSGLNKSGSISRGVSFGNNQDLGVNSSLNLEMTGQLAPNLKLIASISDDNLPIQPDGNTNKLREFDQVFIQVYNDQFKMIAGDFWLYKPKGYFMTYKKRAQGLTISNKWSSDTSKYWATEVSGALSKGKFNRQIIQGVEGNQGPYRLTGAENEPFIIVLAGTERVFIDGKLLERGQDFDYSINYNTAELIFTSRNQITKDSRIVVEFQYSDQNYARSLFQQSSTFHSQKIDFWFNAYSEQDARNQSLQQELSLSQKEQLANIGDSLDLARMSSIDSIGYFDNQNLYRMTDSLGYDSVLVYSVDPNAAFYRATFEFVGAGKGNYVLNNYNALGKVFVWVEPVAGVQQGDYNPSRLIMTPKQKTMLTSGIDYRINNFLRLETELAYSKNDINTFSRFNSSDDNSGGTKLKLSGKVPLSKDSIPVWNLKLKLETEGRDRYFSPIEQYRAVEFDRDWNTRNKNYQGYQLASSIGANFEQTKKGNFNLEGQQFIIGSDFNGYRSVFNGKWRNEGLNAIWDASYLKAQAEKRSEFVRHRADISQQLWFFRLGFKDDHELNLYRTDSLDANSYQFYDYQFYLSNNDTSKNEFRMFYRERYDYRPSENSLKSAAKARSTGGEIKLTELKNQKLNVVVAYRELFILDSTLINQTPENTLLGRIDHELSVFRNALSVSSFYEAGSGLELKKEFLYIQVNDGQGIYTWIDYNSDGIKDLNEFEIAQYVDQASYIRVFTPSNEYIKTYSNELNQTIFWRPERIWSNKKGALKLLSRFSDQSRVRINRKINDFTGSEAFNPFATGITDEQLISTNTNIRNTLFFNRTSTIFGADYSFQDVRSKSLLASGFDSRMNSFHELSFRWNIRKQFTIQSSGKKGVKESKADYTSGRDFYLSYYFFEPKLIYQPTTVFRISLEGRVSEKKNKIDFGGEIAKVYEIGSTFKYNQIEKGSFQANFKVVSIEYKGEQNSALGFEMLEALKPGVNYTWTASYQRSISKNLQLSFQYNGRKSPGNKTIHSGGMEVRAFF